MPSGRPRSATLWLQLLLVASLAFVVLVLSEAFTAARSGQAVVERALTDYAKFAAWSYREHAMMRLREAADELLGPVNHGEALHDGPGIPDARELGHYIRWDIRCDCHRPHHGPSPERFLGFRLGADTVGVGVNFAPDSIAGWLADPPGVVHSRRRVVVYAPDESRWVNGLLSQVARRSPRSDWGYDIVVAHYDSLPRVFASRSMPTIRGDTIVYAVEYEAAALSGLLGSVMSSSDLLPPSVIGRRTNRDVLNLEVIDSAGGSLFQTPTIPWRDAPTMRLPPSYGGLRVRTQLRPELASAIVIGGVPRSRVPLVLALLVLTVGLSVLAAWQLRREVKFAGERATFVANVSHELRTPLTQVRLVLDTLRLGRAGDEASKKDALGVANREVLRLQHLVEGVLRFTRGSRRDGQLVRTDVAREARSLVDEFQPLAAPRDVRVVLTSDDKAEATLHTGALRHVLLNLLDNAVKYGRESSTVTVDVRRLDQGRPGVRVSVTDTGPGVPASERERIWRPFERGGAAQRRASGGSGIGLTIVREIAVEHGGAAWVESGPGGGARFVVDLRDVTS